MAELGQHSYFMNPNSDDAKGNEVVCDVSQILIILKVSIG